MPAASLASLADSKVSNSENSEILKKAENSEILKKAENNEILKIMNFQKNNEILKIMNFQKIMKFSK